MDTTPPRSLLKRILPKTLYVRFLLIIILPTIITQGIATYMFYERHWNSVTHHMTNALVGEIVIVTHIVQKASPKERQAFLNFVQSHMYLRVTFDDKAVLAKTYDNPWPEFKPLKRTLAKAIRYPFSINYTNKDRDIAIQIELDDGVLNIKTSRKRLINPTTYIFILWMTGSAFLLLVISILFSRNQIRSISRLAAAAEAFGKGRDIENFKPEGAREIRQSGAIFLEMKERIERHISQRTEMLAGVSHDLRTPITRMKLQLGMMDDSDATRSLKMDVSEMEQMIKAYLDFVRGDSTEKTEIEEITTLHERFKEHYCHHTNIHFHTEGTIDHTIHLRPFAFKRAVCNIIDNALRYGTDVDVIFAIDKYSLYVTVSDNGPGIPEAMREEVFRPFFRLDASRNAETGGVGLGLSIARDIINSHGGKILLDQSASGGLKVTIVVPF